MDIEVAGENSLIIYFIPGKITGDLSENITTQVQVSHTILRTALSDVLIDLIPSYASLLVIFDIYHCTHDDIAKRIREAIDASQYKPLTDKSVVTLPVYYSDESGPDLQLMARRSRLSVEEVKAIHQATEYSVHAIGFAPGFAYLGEVDKRIAAPRLATPRKKVPKGAVAIADRQTAVYPSESPGGWNLIGLCPVPMFTPNSEKLMPVAVGDCVRFKAIDRAEYIEIKEAFDKKIVEGVSHE